MLKGLYTQGAAAHGSVRISVKTSIIPFSNVRQVLHSKPSSTKFVLATCKIRRMKAIAPFKNEFWCMDLYYVDKLAKNANGVKYLLVCQDVYDKTVDSKRMKTRNSKETVRTFLTVSKKTNNPRKTGSKREQNFWESIKNFAELKEIKFTLQWKRLRLHLLNVPYDPWKIYFTVIWTIMKTGTFTNCLIQSQPLIPGKIAP